MILNLTFNNLSLNKHLVLTILTKIKSHSLILYFTYIFCDICLFKTSHQLSCKQPLKGFSHRTFLCSVISLAYEAFSVSVLGPCSWPTFALQNVPCTLHTSLATSLDIGIYCHGCLYTQNNVQFQLTLTRF